MDVLGAPAGRCMDVTGSAAGQRMAMRGAHWNGPLAMALFAMVRTAMACPSLKCPSLQWRGTSTPGTSMRPMLCTQLPASNTSLLPAPNYFHLTALDSPHFSSRFVCAQRPGDLGQP
eukprot:283489-Chlamydomonas_euryale.AAC.4